MTKDDVNPSAGEIIMPEKPPMAKDRFRRTPATRQTNYSGGTSSQMARFPIRQVMNGASYCASVR